jgi:PAS domain S-box-containing protein
MTSLTLQTPSGLTFDPHHFVSRAAPTLAAEAPTFSESVDNAIRAALPELGDFGFLEFREGERICCAAQAHDDPPLQCELRKIAALREQDGSTTFFVLRGGAPDLQVNANDAGWDTEPTVSQDVHRYGFPFRSLITVPMRYRGDLIGAITLFMGRSGRTHTPQHLECAEELATIAAPFVVNSRLIEQHLKAREALQRSEEFLRTATEAGELGLWEWDIPGDLITCSKRLLELHGLPADRPAGQSKDFIALIHPDDIDEVNARREAAFAGTGDYIVEFRPLRPDGRVCWLCARAQVFRDSAGRPVRMVGATIDVTRRMEMLERERSLRAEAESARQRLELLAAASLRLSDSLGSETTLSAIADVVVPRLADGCFIDLLGAEAESDRIFVRHAESARTGLGRAAAQLLRSSPDKVGSLAWCAATGRSFRWSASSANEFSDVDDPVMFAISETVGMLAYCVVPLVARGRRIGAVAMVQAESGRGFSDDDASLIEVLAQRAAVALDNSRLFAEAEEARLHAEQARKVAEDASRAKDEFLAMLGHELRNPLAPIVTSLRLMELRGDAAFRVERSVIERQVSNLSRLVDDLLDVARITRGDVRLRRRRVSLRDVLHRAIETVTPLLENRGHRLELDLPDDSGDRDELIVDADEDRLVQVFANLMSNAARYTPEGGQISLLADAEGEDCRIVVVDNGQGISPAMLPRIFELFFQGAQGPDRAHGGLGIGLALVKNLVGLHGGEVEAYSEGLGRGSKFVVKLPLSTLEPPLNPAACTNVPISTPSRRWRILLVDDNRDALESMAAVLELNGHAVRTASDPVSAMAIAADFDAEVAILDIGLPVIDGYELGARLRAAGSACRLFALTGYGLVEDRERSRASGFEQHFVKPIDPLALLGVLGR